MPKLKPFAIQLLAVVTVISAATGGAAQNFSSGGNDWASGWGFQSASDRTLLIQQAQAIRNATQTPGPSTVMSTTNFNTYDNRSNYLHTEGIGATYGNLDVHINGDAIGQNTNSIGAMNTGTTNISVNGDNNLIDATNAADSKGCIDGSVTLTDTPFGSMETVSGIDITLGLTGHANKCSQ
jgi:hypothetical protein